MKIKFCDKCGIEATKDGERVEVFVGNGKLLADINDFFLCSKCMKEWYKLNKNYLYKKFKPKIQYKNRSKILNNKGE